MGFRLKKKKFIAIIASVSLIILLGITIASQSSTADNDEAYKNLKLFTDVIRIVDSNYVEKVDAKELYYGAIRGMLQSLDSHSAFMPPDLYKEMQVETKGSFGGLGIEITIRDNKLTVVSPIDGTPAEKAGIKANDWIVKVNGEATKDMSLTDAVSKMRGPKGTEVTISILRKGWDKLQDFTLVRDIVKIKNISYNMADDKAKIGYIRLRQFQERSDEELADALEDLRRQGMEGLVLDMRNNPGGLLDMAISVSDLFLPKGRMIVSTKGRIESQNREYSAQTDEINNVPIIVLVNGGSASAAEIVAGALQDWHRALVLGEQSFGKGSVQTVIQLSDGSGLRLTTARYYTPNGTSIHAKGITPDVIVQDGELVKNKDSHPTIREKDLRQIPDGDGVQEINVEEPIAKEPEPAEGSEVKEGEKDPKADIQLERAIQILKANKILANGSRGRQALAGK